MLSTTTGPESFGRWNRVVLAFAAFQLGDAVACSMPGGLIRRDLDRLDCPESLQRALPVIKTVSAAGLVVGTRWGWVGRLTAFSLVGYFFGAIGFHLRASDPFWRFLPAATLCAASAVVGTQAFRRRDDVESTP